jgi:hypothetical protein
MSPLGATTTALARSSQSGPLPGIPGLPSVINTCLRAELDDHGALAVPRPLVGHPHIAFAVDIEAVRLVNMPPPNEVRNLPEASNFWIGARVELPQSLEAQRSNTQMLLPSL